MNHQPGNFIPRPVRVSQLGHLRNGDGSNPSQRRKVTAWAVLRETFYDYALMTKVNGMYYMRRNVTTGFARFVWVTILSTLFSLGVLLVVLLWKKYLDSPTRMTIASDMSILQVPFPGITICHPQSVLDYKAVKFVEKIKFPLGATKANVLESLPSLGYFNEHQWTFPRSQNLKMIDNVLTLNNLTVEDAINELGSICEDFIVVCYWAGTKFPCFQNNPFLSWIGSTSHYGACCSFNYHPSVQGSFVPFAVNTYGIHGGLSVVATGFPQASDGKSGALYSEGFMLMIHHPHDYAVEAAPLTLLRLGTETFVSVTPTDSRCSEQVLGLPPSQRSCVTGKDFSPPIENYRQPACTLECVRNEVHRKCGCHPYHLPRQSQQPTKAGKPMRDCTVTDSMCLIENYYMFKKTDCKCLPSCSDVTYKTSTVVTDFSAHNYSINKFYKETNLTNFEFIFHVYLANQVVAANRRIVVVSWINLLANLGGVFSLCLGMSIISLFEVLFYLFFRIPRIHQQLQQQQRESEVKVVAAFTRLQTFPAQAQHQ
ncbi:sodium channel protein Nach-like [Culex pipiens pallens]|uniref:sodium channel protein Nach-like n=1 Tax=Culex pipiens pallens TaxID=42434 RepID=UPI0019548E19|nr:sodium channel protein Nach-like [Culex pipiens pallens]